MLRIEPIIAHSDQRVQSISDLKSSKLCCNWLISDFVHYFAISISYDRNQSQLAIDVAPLLLADRIKYSVSRLLTSLECAVNSAAADNLSGKD